MVLLFLHPTLAQAGSSFAGRWTGQYVNSVGDRGDDTLVLEEDRDGRLRGTWTGNIEVFGRRIDENTAELHGRTQTREYRITLRRHHDGLTLHYVARRLDAPGEYKGESHFTRDRFR
jgi:hypothetical protein